MQRDATFSVECSVVCGSAWPGRTQTQQSGKPEGDIKSTRTEKKRMIAQGESTLVARSGPRLEFLQHAAGAVCQFEAGSHEYT